MNLYWGRGHLQIGRRFVELFAPLGCRKAGSDEERPSRCTSILQAGELFLVYTFEFIRGAATSQMFDLYFVFWDKTLCHEQFGMYY